MERLCGGRRPIVHQFHRFGGSYRPGYAEDAEVERNLNGDIADQLDKNSVSVGVWDGGI